MLEEWPGPVPNWIVAADLCSFIATAATWKQALRALKILCYQFPQDPS